MARRNGGFIGTDGLDAPDPPTGVTPTAGNESVSVAFTAPTDTGTSAITGFVAQVSTDDTAYSAGSNTGTSSPIVVSSLTNGTAATAKVWAINAYGTSAPSTASDSFTPVSSRALFFGGYLRVNTIDFVEIDTAGNAQDFGDLTTYSIYNGACSSSTRAVRGGGSTDASSAGAGSSMETMDYVTIASTGNAQDFGDLTTDRYHGDSGFSNSTRGIFGGGNNESDTLLDIIEYITIASTGDGTDFGNLVAASRNSGSFCSATRGVFAGGRNDNGNLNTVQYITIGSTGNTTDFGDLTTATSQLAGCSSATRGLVGGGYTSAGVNTIEYFTIDTTGNATDFGNLSVARYLLSATSSSIRGLFGGGYGSGVQRNTLDFVTIASTGNASDFGDLTVVGNGMSATAASHGGLS